MVRGDSIESAVATTICYFDIFACAPRRGEIYRFLLGRSCSQRELDEVLETSLALRQLVETKDGFWFLRGKAHLAPRRIRFLEHSRQFWPEAHRIGRLIERSGLANCALVTGSLAADNSDEHADIDLLLTYPADRAWTSYAAVRLLAKLPALGLRNMCPNYALPDDALEIRPQNLFTAWEIAKAVPIFGFEIHERFLRANAWVGRYLPHALPQGMTATIARRKTDPRLLRRVTASRPFRALEEAERRRKFDRDTRDVGVDMQGRLAQGSYDRHTPTRPFQTLSELKYRMQNVGLTGHPLFAELERSTQLYTDEMTRWGDEPIEGTEPQNEAPVHLSAVPSVNRP